MFKNSKFLKGITLVFALVLLIGCGVVFNNVVAASPKTVVMYVGDPGDNTSGSDEASALNTLNAAIQKANDMKLPVGSELKLIVVDRLTITTKAVDDVLALDADGHRLPITITSLETTNEDQFADLYLAYFDSAASSGEQNGVFYNDITFKDIGITVKVQQDRVGNVATAKRWMQKDLYFIGDRVSFDHCVIRKERTDADTDKLSCYVDYNANDSTLARDKVVNVKNGDYSGADWYLHKFTLPNDSLTFNTENATFGLVALAPITSTATSQDLKKLTVNLRAGTTINNIYVAEGGHVDIPGGITVNYYEGCNITNRITSYNDSADSGAALASDITHNIYGGNLFIFYGGSKGLTTGNVTLNMYGGHLAGYYGGGDGSDSKVTGVVTNNIYGGSIGTFYGGGKATKHTKIINNVYGGELGTYYGAGGDSVAVESVENNITGGTFTGDAVYCGGKGKVTVDSLVNNIKDCTIGTIYYGGSVSGTIGSIVNNMKDCAIQSVFYGGSESGTVGSIENNLESAKVASIFFGGSKGSSTVGSIVNNVSGDFESSNSFYAGNNNATANVTGSLTNNISDGHFKNVAYLGDRRGNQTGPIINNISGGIFDSLVFGGLRGDDAVSSIQGDIITTISGGVIHGSFIGGHNEDVAHYGNITNIMTGGIIYGGLVGGNYKNGAIHGSITTNLNGGTIHGNVNGVNRGEGGAEPSYLRVQPKSDAQSLILYGEIATNEKLTTNFYGGDAPLMIGSAFKAEGCSFNNGEPLTVSQIEEWVADHAYVTLNAAVSTNSLLPVNGSSAVDGSGSFNGTVLKGSAAVAGNDQVAPGLATMYSFRVSDHLGVRFWVEKSAVEAYLQAKGNWSYSVTLSGNEIAKTDITSLDQIPAKDIMVNGGVEYVTFTAGVSIPASQFNDELTVVLGGVNSTTCTVFELLESGVSQYEEAGRAELAQLLKALHNYGTQASHVFRDGDGVNRYATSYTGSYTTLPSLTGMRGYRFKEISLSLDEKIAMNFYADFATDVTFKAVVAGTNEELDPSKIIVKKVEAADDYNTIVTLKLDADEMNKTYVLSAMIGDETVATCTNSIAYSCTLYQQNGRYVELVDSILAYLEAVKAVVA